MAKRLIPQSSLRGLILVLTLSSVASIQSCGGNSPNVPTESGPPACDQSLWSHVHEPERLQVWTPCRTVTGTVVNHHESEDGDFVMQVKLDPEFESMLIAGNRQSLGGRLQVEAVCQAPVLKYAEAACAGFRGTVPIPADGTRVEITGTHVLDTNHGWMEIHPVSVIRAQR